MCHSERAREENEWNPRSTVLRSTSTDYGFLGDQQRGTESLKIAPRVNGRGGGNANLDVDVVISHASSFSDAT